LQEAFFIFKAIIVEGIGSRSGAAAASAEKAAGGRRQAAQTAWSENAGGGRAQGDSLLPL